VRRALAAAAVLLAPGWPMAARAQSPSEPSRTHAPSAPAPASPDRALETVVGQAEAAKKAGKLDVAAGYYQKALALKPTWIDGHWALATLLYDLDRFAEAREHFRPVVADRPKDGVAWAMTGLCDVRVKDYEWALADLQKALSLGIPNPEVASVARYQLAMVLNHGGDSEGAFELLREFAIQRKDSPSVIVAFGLVMLRLPLMPEDVPEDKQEMVRLAGHGGYHMARGRRTAVGRLALEELVSRFPTEPNVHYAFGVYLASEEPELALQEFRAELRSNPEHFPALLKIASLETSRGHGPEAVEAARKAVALQPKLPGAHLILGRALLEAGDAETAVSELEAAAALAPASGDVQFALARAYQRAGRAEDAARARQAFLKIEREDKSRRAAATPGAEDPDAGPDAEGGRN
jgi:tetratricopeptide (TPR) repeat protein